MRVLIVKTSSMGDVLHTLPALTDAQQAIPGINLTGWWKKGSHRFLPGTLPFSALSLWQYVAGVKPGFLTIKAERKAFREALQAENYDGSHPRSGAGKKARRW